MFHHSAWKKAVKNGISVYNRGNKHAVARSAEAQGGRNPRSRARDLGGCARRRTACLFSDISTLQTYSTVVGASTAVECQMNWSWNSESLGLGQTS